MIKSVYITVLFFFSVSLVAQEAEILYLSGKGPDDAIEWDFYCTDGRNSGSWTKIKVPSNWELEGFGTYNYGLDRDTTRGKETGMYKHQFTVPENWNGKSVKIVFEGSMTDTEVKINGKPAGDIHQGSFYRFSYDISDILEYGSSNLLEVTVAKHSSNESVNLAERFADYWIFGGIFRPVYLEVLPRQHISNLVIDAGADGNFQARMKLNNIIKKSILEARIYTMDGYQAGDDIILDVSKKTSSVDLESRIKRIEPWSPEFPNLYYLEILLIQGNETVHQVVERFGFRTVELKERDGIYVNGKRIMLKGVCRHSFWPSTGRCLSKEMSITDVNLMKDMNMNSVRMSHYPPDEHFLDVCDSLGLFVIDELAGWQTCYDSVVGAKLIREMIERDVNHPSIIIWSNGNEGGWNWATDKWFEYYDPQKRPLIHPWGQVNGTDTHHYPKYTYGINRYNNSHYIYFPTELLHGLYDGGHGAGLEDFWNMYKSDPLAAGGYLWDFSDESVVRTDKNGLLDSDSNHGADGIVGPYREKEGSFYTVKEIWAPVQFPRKYITEAFDGKLEVINEFIYTDLSQCTFTRKVLKIPDPSEMSTMPVVISYNEALSPFVDPGEKGILSFILPDNFFEGDVLSITATDPHGREIYTWTLPIKVPREVAGRIIARETTNMAVIVESGDLLTVTGGDVNVTFDKTTGEINRVQNRDGLVSFNGGPRPAGLDATFKTMSYRQDEDDVIIEAIYEGGIEKITWTMNGNGLLKMDMKYMTRRTRPSYLHCGITFDYPGEKVSGMTWMGQGPYRVWKNRMKGTTLNIWHKDYNNTITGESYDRLVYPEFKGYHAGLYWVTVENSESSFTVLCESENVFLRMLTPDPPDGAYNKNTAPEFPGGDISFLHEINAIGTKFKPTGDLGPMSQPGLYNQHKGDVGLPMVLWFDFR